MDSRKLFLIQSYLDNWKIYQDILNQKSSLPFWDLCILTASNQDQANAYRIQIDTRMDSGLLPKQTQFLILPDPDGKRIGSGGATLNALVEIAKNSHSDNPFLGKRILIIHSGGDSKRIPHYSVFGKIFSKIPRELPNGTPSTLFDETFITLSGLPSRMQEGVMTISGDVLLIFNHTQLDFERMGVIGVSVKTDADSGSRHGVFIEDPITRRVKRFFHKSPEEKLKEYGALDVNEQVSIDTGIVWFDPYTADILLNLVKSKNSEINEEKVNWWLSEKLNLNLYGDFLYPLAQESTFNEYLYEASEKPKTPELIQARQKIWNCLHEVPFYVETLSPAQFIHFGSTSEYQEMILTRYKEYQDIGWERKVLSYCSGINGNNFSTLHSFISASTPVSPQQVIIEDSELEGVFSFGSHSLLSNIRYQGKKLELAENIIIQQLPLKNNRFVTRIYGVSDNPKETIEVGTFLNRPWRYWFQEVKINPADIWDQSTDSFHRTLWNAKLFPVCDTRDESLEIILWIQNPEKVPLEIFQKWLNSPRISLNESMILADRIKILQDQYEIENRVRAELFFEAIRQKKPVLESLEILGNNLKNRVLQVEYWIERTRKTPDPLERMRYYRALAEIVKIFPSPSYQHKSKELEEMAFQELNDFINIHIEKRSIPSNRPQVNYSWVRVSTAARADLGGGWSDTPPFCNEYGGVVLNCALELNHSVPIQVTTRRIDEPILVFKSIDLNLEKKISTMNELLNYKNPSDCLALHKASIFFSGFLPEEENCSLRARLEQSGGLELTTRVDVPKGSGLGISSILAASMLICLSTLFGESQDEKILFEKVLGLEQKLTTGGGWQDQVGGITPGIKLVTTRPGFPQYPEYEPVLLNNDIMKKMNELYIIIYTGQKRLAKNILRDMMSGYILANPVVVRSLHEIKEIAKSMREALMNGDFARLGSLIAKHWEINKKMDPGCTNLLIERIFEVCSPFIFGGKLCGAGGGGFMEVIVKDAEAIKYLRMILKKEFPDENVSMWPACITENSVIIERA